MTEKKEMDMDEREGGDQEQTKNEQEEEEDWDAQPPVESYLSVFRRRFPHIYRAGSTKKSLRIF